MLFLRIRHLRCSSRPKKNAASSARELNQSHVHNTFSQCHPIPCIHHFGAPFLNQQLDLPCATHCLCCFCMLCLHTAQIALTLRHPSYYLLFGCCVHYKNLYSDIKHPRHNRYCNCISLPDMQLLKDKCWGFAYTVESCKVKNASELINFNTGRQTKGAKQWSSDIQICIIVGHYSEALVLLYLLFLLVFVLNSKRF